MTCWNLTPPAVLALCLAAVPLRAQDPIPNAGFESWSGGEPVGWTTSNTGSLPKPFTQVSDRHSGSWAVRGEVTSTTETCDLLSGTSEHGIGVTVRWAYLRGYYKFSPDEGESLNLGVLMYKGGLAGTLVGGGSLNIFDPANVYTEFLVPINYFTADTPDTALIFAYLSNSLSDSQHVGTYYQLDDLVFTMSTNVCPVLVTGDVNMSGDRAVSDIVYLVNFVLKAGPSPSPCIAAGDVNCDGTVSTSDIIYLVNAVLKAGPVPCDVCVLIDLEGWFCP